MLNVQMSKGILAPASKCLRSEPWIVANVAKAVLGDNSSIDWDAFAFDYDLIRDAIERVIPGFEDYNRRIREKGGFYLPNKPREGVFQTDSGKAVFKAHSLEKLEVAPGRLLLTTIRSHDQFNTTIYGNTDRYRGVEGGRRVIFMNQSDIGELGLAAGNVVDITSHFDDGERYAKRFVVVPYAIPAGCAAAYFPEANPLVPLGNYAKRSGTPASKSIVISLKATGETAGDFA
jgi:anaerobic selenocysteine-containing dehydrogenase